MSSVPITSGPSHGAVASGHVAESGGRILEIDALRGLCATAVMLYHYVVRYDAVVGFSGSPNPAADVEKLGLRDISTLPVYVFFIISGFVIYMTLERVKNGAEFIVSRASRIFPIYWVAVLLTYVSWELYPVFSYHITPLEMLVNLTMLQSFLYVPHVDGVYWSLGVEIAFYAAMFLLLVFGGLQRIRWFCIAWLAVSALYGVLGDTPPFFYRVVLLLDLRYAHFFVIGIVTYRMWLRRHDAGDWLLLAACVPGLFLHFSWEAAVVMCGFTGVFLLLAFGYLKILTIRPLVFLGEISYALYLVHQMIGYQIIYGLGRWPVIGVTAAIITSLGIAIVVTRFVEKPAVRAIRTVYKAWIQRRSAGTVEIAAQ